MKKIKQLANNAFVRPDRTEVLSESLLDAERRIDQIKVTCETLAKKIQGCLQSQGKDVMMEKRIRKVPECLLGYAMADQGKQLGDGSALGQVLAESGEIEIKVGQALVVDFEIKIEEFILKPLQQLMENDLPNIYKLKRQLGKHTETMDLAKAKHQQASRHSMTAGQGTKIDNIKEEWEDAQQKVEQCRDNLAAEMYALIARESELSRLIVDFLNFQKEYHNSVFSIMTELVSSVEARSAFTHKPSYGTDLSIHLSTTQRTIAYPIELCVCGLLETALDEEGLFRMAGSASKVKKLKSAFDAELVDLGGLLVEFRDPHVVANALKCYLRELPEPLLTFCLYKEWITAIQIQDQRKKHEALWTVLQSLPTGNYDNLRYLVKFLTELSNHSDSNKMSPQNIAIVIAPNLLWSPPISGCFGDDLDNNQMHSMTMTHLYSSVLDQLVTNCNYFFPEDINFFVTCTKPVECVVNGLQEESSSSEEQTHNHNHKVKRSTSNSSMDEHSPPQGSPKPVLRRKNKPAPVPPIQNHQNKNPLANLAGSNNKVQPFSPERHNINSAKSQNPLTPTNSFKNKSNVHQQGSEPVKTPVKEKREGLWIPPSPKETRRRLGGGSGGNLSDMSISIVPPAKPPPPSMTALQNQELKKQFIGERGEPPPKPASPLRHKSSFKSNSIETNDQPLNTTDNHEPKTPITANPAFSSLPRHFHTDNSYKNQRAPRPPSMFGVPPPAPPQIPHGSISLQPEKISIAPSSQYDYDELKFTAGQIKNVQLEFEKVETLGKKNATSFEQERLEEQEPQPSSPSPTPAPTLRPVPAPRSSLLLQSNSFREKDDGGPTGLKERPSLMAKPRDLNRRNPSQTQSQPLSETNTELSENHKNTSHSLTESVEEYQDVSKNNGISKGCNRPLSQLPPLSPTGNNPLMSMPNRPPRPQPPHPPGTGPKVKLMPHESTDL